MKSLTMYKVAVFAAHLVNAHHAGMLDLCRRPGLANEHLGLRPLDLAAAGDLDRHDAVELRVAGLPDRAEMPAADAFQKLEMPDRSYGPRSVGGRFAADQAEIAAARWASDVGQGVGIDHLDRIMAVGTADVHGQPRDNHQSDRGKARLRHQPTRLPTGVSMSGLFRLSRIVVVSRNITSPTI